MKKELSHKDDVRGMLVPFEAPDGTTLRRVVTAVMVLAIGLLIAALVTLAFHYRDVSERAQAERRGLREQLEQSTQAITQLLEFQARNEAGSAERLKVAIDAVVEQVNEKVEETIRETHKELVEEHYRIIDAVE